MTTSEVLPAIAYDTIKVGDLTYEPGDAFDPQVHLRSNALSERNVQSLKNSNHFGPITREMYARAIGKRPEGTVGRGLTQAGLIAAGIIDKPAPKKAKAPEDPKKKGKKEILKVPLTDKLIEVGENAILPFKYGNFTYYDAVDKEGNLLRPNYFRSADKAREFIEGLVSTAQQNSATSETAQESADDHNLQPEPEQPSK